LEDLRALVTSRLDRLAVLRRRLREVPFGLHHPVWIDDSRFDVEYHVRRSTVADPGGREELGEVVAAILSRPLDRSRPLWELHLVEGLAHDRFTLVTKVHHAAVDGAPSLVAGVPVSIRTAARPVPCTAQTAR
jgi:hypothetical protein